MNRTFAKQKQSFRWSHPLSEDNKNRVAELERRLGIRFASEEVALAALTHKSYANEHKASGCQDNERLEFLGDAVIDLAVSDRLMSRFAQAQEGDLSRLRAAMVSEEGLAAIARNIGLGELLLLGRGENRTGGREKNSVLSDAFEAVIGAIYLSTGLNSVLELVERLFASALQNAAIDSHDYKTLLQEKVQEKLKTCPVYRVVAEQGPDHAKTFSVEIQVDNQKLGRGEGRSKKEAEQAAAQEALKNYTIDQLQNPPADRVRGHSPE